MHYAEALNQLLALTGPSSPFPYKRSLAEKLDVAPGTLSRWLRWLDTGEGSPPGKRNQRAIMQLHMVYYMERNQHRKRADKTEPELKIQYSLFGQN